MFKVIQKIFKLLTSDQRKKFFYLQIYVLLMSIAEIIGLSSIIPFMKLVGDINQIKSDTIIFKIYQFSGINSEIGFLILMGLFVLTLLFISSFTSIFTLWKLSMFANKTGTEISDRLYNYYINKNWLFYSSTSIANLTKKISVESSRLTSGILIPLIQINARVSIMFFITIILFFYNAEIALVGSIIFGFAYAILYKFVKSKLQKNGRIISEVNESRFRLINEVFGGIKELKILGREFEFLKLFKKSSSQLAFSQGINTVIASVPRYFIEFIAYGSIISLLLYLISSFQGEISKILPLITFFALAGFKLLPSFQIVYSSTARIKGNIAAFESIEQDLIDSKKEINSDSNLNKFSIFPKDKITLENVTFIYPQKKIPVIKELSITIPSKKIIGVVGKSGSGKSTLIDILLGLIKPDIGKLKVDNEIIDEKNVRSWQNSLGYVGQDIFITEGTVAENIALGVPKKFIDYDRVKDAIKKSFLDEVILDLKEDINSAIGERGIQLSGGQRQRLGIARALYHDAKVLFFDEATSSLDGITEKIIMQSIHSMDTKKTIIIVAHRLMTVKKCDKILFLDKGRLVDHGTYEELLLRNVSFHEMSNSV